MNRGRRLTRVVMVEGSFRSEPWPDLTEEDISVWVGSHKPDRVVEHESPPVEVGRKTLTVRGEPRRVGLFSVERDVRQMDVPDLAFPRWTIREWWLPDGRVWAVEDAANKDALRVAAKVADVTDRN